MNKPTLFGYGITTKAIASKLGGGCQFFDDNIETSYFDKDNNKINPSCEFNPDMSSLEITTPSLPPSHKLIKDAQNLISEYEYFLSPKYSDKIPFNIWISGTNGKTTTTQMVTHLLSSKGAVSGGNIGVPLANLDKNAPIWVLESSSFTLHHTNSVYPNIYLLLPITPDHIDWHGDANEYSKSKLKPLIGMREGEMALIPKGLQIPNTSAFVVEYDTPRSIAEFFDIDISKVNFKGAFLEDALLSLAITKALFNEIDYKLINSFIVDSHRQEEIKDSKNRVWINDSKATNVDASIKAVETFGDSYIHLILGGIDKGANLTPLFETLQKYNLKIYTIGTNAKKLIDLAEEYNIDALECNTLKNAIDEINIVLKIDEVALLSPASASFDQFTSYKDRGDKFKNIILTL
ncbi:UDP-N-acetylmuramoylalanine--D-glutamate ligase [hydrothermal vent metagenome]|uniref:UDP-N-acetylmuramoylalanine--D-glutamate ligase n=1 Tax=hydrothermal vent metagenome TaxID=652676 RepID=A0A1W1EJV0_9ZZZZ